jgi:CRISPR/Cas system CMR-associated protein Cmr3 (group 5 of RAMP superfamily)
MSRTIFSKITDINIKNRTIISECEMESYGSKQVISSGKRMKVITKLKKSIKYIELIRSYH